MNSKAFVVGHPISHSRSPKIHQYWLRKYQLPGSYELCDVDPPNLPALFFKVKMDEYVGGNVTIPHKQQAATLCDRLTASAKLLGAVNTIYKQDDILIGDNTDGEGFLANLDQMKPEWGQTIENTIILGAGGATRAIIAALVSRGAAKITILNRTLGNAVKLSAKFSALFRELDISADHLEAFSKYAKDTTLLINSSSVGLNDTSFENLDLSLLHKDCLVHDIVYTPIITPLLRSAGQCGLQTLDGLGMLLHQAAPGFEKWFGIFPTVSSELRQLILSDINR